MKNALFYRSFELDRAKLDKKNRSVEVSFSSEFPVERSWMLGPEILLHGESNVDLSRLKSMGAALFNHQPNLIIGPLKDVRVEDKRGLATVIFDDDEDGNRAMRKVESGSLRGVSVGYSIMKMRRVDEKETWNGIKGPAYVATRWAPYEISLTPIPADPNVGIGRDATRNLDGIEIEHGIQTTDSNTIAREGDEMTRDEILQIVREALAEQKKAPTVEEVAGAVRALIVEENKPKFRITPEEYASLMDRAGAIGDPAKIMVADAFRDGKSNDEIKDALLVMATGSQGSGGTGQGGDGTGGNGDNERTGPVTSFEQIDDDTFYRSLMDPA